MAIKETYVRTASDLERKYNLSSLTELKPAVEANKIGLTKLNNSVNTFVNDITKEIEDLEGLEDGLIITWFYDTTPTLLNEPAINWTTYETKQSHIGDVYYDTSSGKGYRYNFDSTEEVFLWNEIKDDDVIQSLAIANADRDTDDHKRNIFTKEPKPEYGVGDIWIKEDNLYRCQTGRQDGDIYHESDWILATDYSSDTAAKNSIAQLSAYKTIVNTKYVTDAALKVNADSITMSVQTAERVANSKSKVFTTTPTVPYHKGDIYYKERLDATSGLTFYDMYVCQVNKEEGFYSENDFIVQQTYSSGSAITVTNNSIKGVVREIGDRTDRTTTIAQDIRNLEISVMDVTDMTSVASSDTARINSSEMQNILESEPVSIEIHPLNENISYLYPNSNLYPSSGLLLKTRTLVFHNVTTNEYFPYEIPNNLLYYDEDNYDEFLMELEGGVCQVIKRCEYNSNGEVVLKSEEETIEYDYHEFGLTAGDYEIYIIGYTSGFLKVRLLVLNAYTANYVTQAQFKSGIRLTKDSIEEEVDAQFRNVDGTIDELNSKVTQNATSITSEVTRATQAEGTLGSRVTQTERNITSLVTDTGNLSSRISQSAKDITLNVTNGSTSSGISITTTKEDGTQTTTPQATITMTGLVKFTDLSSAGSTTINGANIQTGTINATKIATGSITTDKLVVGAVSNEKIQDGAINANKIAAGTITADKLAAGSVTADKIVVGAIDNSKIQDGAINAAKVNADIITTSNFSAQEINADRITSGTLNADYVQGGTLSGSSINIGGTNYYLRMGSNWTKNPEVSGLNVGNKGVKVNGVGFNVENNEFVFSNGVKTAYLKISNDATISGNATVYGTLKTNNISPGGHLEMNPASCTIKPTYGDIYLDATNGGRNSSYFVYAKGGTVGKAKVATSSSGPSSKILKKNIKDFKQKEYDDAIELLNDIKMYDYEYKYNIHPKKDQFGFIIDDLIENEKAKKYFHFFDETAGIDENNSLDYSAREDNNPEKYDLIDFKRYDEETLLKYVLVVCKAQQQEIQELKNEIQKIKESR